MYLKSLVLHGFKSFPNRTVLTFERGATVIVGPNGSGKSNISDAMRWVLGELSSRNIRGTKMEDVIFGGTDDRRPMGFAEVSVCFDNSDPENRLDSEFDEVTVTRRYYRTGESEYLINKQPKRLRDIYELFMNTGVGREGYSIIGQGKIAEIVSKKSEDRRTIFEEAAGISKYRHRKEESMRNLKTVQENMDRVKDILTELENRVGPLEKEAERARRGLAVYEEKKRADVSLWLYDSSQILEDLEKADDALKLSRHELETIDAVIAELDAQADALFNKSQSNKLISAELYQKISATQNKLHQLDSAVRSAESDFAHSGEMIGQCRIRIEEIERNVRNLEGSIAEYDDREATLQKKIKELSDARLEILADAQQLSEKIEQARRELQEALDELTVEENSATDLKVHIDVLKNSTVTDGTKSQDLEEEIKRYEKVGVELKEEADRCEENAAGFKRQIAEKDAILAEAGAKVDSLSEEHEQITAILNKQKLEYDTMVQRAAVLQRMNDHFEGYAGSVKFVMQAYEEGKINSRGRIHGPLSKLIHVEKDYITAIETALGSSLQNIVVDDEDTAKAAIYALKNAGAGRATFYPISAIRSASETDEIRDAAKMQGYVNRADVLVDSAAEYRGIIEWLLLRTVVFDNIDSASAAAKKLRYRVRIVTLDGQLINIGGSFTGGSTKHDSGILSRSSEIASLRARAEEMKAKIDEDEKALSEILDELHAEQNRAKDAEQEKEILLTVSRTQFAALDNANAKYEANRNIIDKLRYDYNNLVGEKAKAEEQIRALGVEYDANLERIAALKSFREKRSAEMGEMDDKNDELKSRANDLYISITAASKDVESVGELRASVNGRLADLASEKEAQQERIRELSEKKDSIDRVKGENISEVRRMEAELEELNRERREVDSGTDEYERESNALRQKVKERSAAREVAFEASVRCENKLSQLQEKQQKLGSQLWDDYELTPEDAVALGYPPVTAENRAEVAAEQVSCKNRLRAIGNYNPGAIDEYAEVKSRYDALNAQYTDLSGSHDEISDIIRRLEEEMRTSFVKSFNEINRNFGITFKELFGGGSAELLLTEPEDVLTSGIEIKAAPPGKIIKNMSLLSGGEQSFVAIALLFAILRANPTPFCILDEIEAALDEVNVFRFGEYIKKFDDNTQFILITHRRGTMEVGDRLYGVTMPQRGISQAIELNVNEIESKQKELLDGVL